MTYANMTATKTVKAAEVDELCTWIRELLAEIKGYYRSDEKDSFCPAFRKSFEFTMGKAQELGDLQCRGQAAMERRTNMLARCDAELSPYMADYRAILSAEEFAHC